MSVSAIKQQQCWSSTRTVNDTNSEGNISVQF